MGDSAKQIFGGLSKSYLPTPPCTPKPDPTPRRNPKPNWRNKPGPTLLFLTDPVFRTDPVCDGPVLWRKKTANHCVVVGGSSGRFAAPGCPVPNVLGAWAGLRLRRVVWSRTRAQACTCACTRILNISTRRRFRVHRNGVSHITHWV